MAIQNKLRESIDQYKHLSPEEKQRLKLLYAEADRRGIDISAQIKKTKIYWPIDSRGFVTKNDGTKYDPSDNQDGFVRSDAYFSGFIGSRGSGKSAGGAQKAIRKIAKGGHGAVLNPDFENFKTSTWPEFREWIPWDMVVPVQRYRKETEWYPHQPFEMVFLNGVKVICKGVKDPNSARGPNINWLWMDEAQRDPTGDSWKIAVPSVRVGKDPQAWVTATPAGKYHWMYDFFVERDIPLDVIKVLEEMGFEGTLVEWFFGSIDDNKKHLDPMFLAGLLYTYKDDKDLKRQEVEGKFITPEGTRGDRRWFDDKILKSMPDVKIRKRVRYWDLAASEKKVARTRRKKKDPDETAGTLKSWDGDNFYIEDQIAGRWMYDNILHHMHQTAMRDGPFVKIYIEEEPGSGGKNQIAAIKKFFKEGDDRHNPLPYHKIEGHRPEGDKIMRADIWFKDAKEGKVYLIEGSWNEELLTQVDNFPEMPYDDLVDSVSGARLNVAPIKSWSRPKFVSLSSEFDDEGEEEDKEEAIQIMKL
jgi:predicted phage terminase large subunit-like protein